MTDPDIPSAISLGPDGRIAVTYVEWGDEDSQEIVVPWTMIDGPAAAEGFAEALMSQPRQAFGRNAIGSAITFAQLLIERSEEHTSELQSLMRISYAVFCLKKNTKSTSKHKTTISAQETPRRS